MSTLLEVHDLKTPFKTDHGLVKAVDGISYIVDEQEIIGLGKTELMISKIGLGGVPLQRLTDDEAAAVTKRCLDKGTTFLIRLSNTPIAKRI